MILCHILKITDTRRNVRRNNNGIQNEEGPSCNNSEEETTPTVAEKTVVEIKKKKLLPKRKIAKRVRRVKKQDSEYGEDDVPDLSEDSDSDRSYRDPFVKVEVPSKKRRKGILQKKENKIEGKHEIKEMKELKLESDYKEEIDQKIEKIEKQEAPDK